MITKQEYFIRKLIREKLDKHNSKQMYFLRWTSDAYDDMIRNFSGNMQAWFETKKEAMADYNERISKDIYIPYPPKKDITNGMWNSEPEWGLSGYGFYDENTFSEAINNIKEISWHHKEGLNQDLYVFKSDNYKLGDGFDGEDVFKDVKTAWNIEPNMDYNDVMKVILES